MAIITINTTPISEYFLRFVESLGIDGIMIMFLCIMIYLFCGIIQLERKSQDSLLSMRKTELDSRKVDFFYKKLNEAETKEDFNKLRNLQEKNKDAFYY